MELKTLDRIPLKNNPKINEDMIQEFIFNDPSVLGLGDLTAVQRPKVVEIPATNEAYAMIWVIRCYGGKLKAKKYFRACCRYLEKPID